MKSDDPNRPANQEPAAGDTVDLQCDPPISQPGRYRLRVIRIEQQPNGRLLVVAERNL